MAYRERHKKRRGTECNVDFVWGGGKLHTSVWSTVTCFLKESQKSWFEGSLQLVQAYVYMMTLIL